MEERFFDEYSRIEREHWWFRARRSILEKVLHSAVGSATRLRVLDVGCGTGESSRHLSQWGDVTSLDISHRALDFCRRHQAGSVVRGDAMRLPFTDDTFDLVCGLDMIEHLEHDAEALSELARVCRPEGHILVTVPALPMLWSDHDILNHHYRRYLRRDFARLFNRMDLDVRALNYFNTLLFPAVLVVRWFGRMRSLLRPRVEVVSDFAHSRGGLLAPVLQRVFATERFLVEHIPMPIGVSLLCLARKPSPKAPDAFPTRERWESPPVVRTVLSH